MREQDSRSYPVREDMRLQYAFWAWERATWVALALPDDGMRHELLDGVHAVTPAPAYLHQRMVREIARRLGNALEGQDRYEVLWSPADIRMKVSPNRSRNIATL